MLNVLKDILTTIKKNNYKNNCNLFITFKTNFKDVVMPKWLKSQYPKEMTIVIQHEYWNINIHKKNFEILLSFNNIKANLSIPYNSIISFADPDANFGLTLITQKNEKKPKNKKNKDNVINFSNFKKLN